MDIRTDIPLKSYTTMKLGGPARFMGEAQTPQDIATIYHNARPKNLPIFILGGGSNLIVRDEGYPGIVVRNLIKGFTVIEDTPQYTTFEIGAGENWDETVKRTVELHLTGIEALSAIPGTVGAAPVQNIGAYGQEVADSLISLQAYDSQEDRFVVLQNIDCGFSYRHSIFRGEAEGRYVITSVQLKLWKANPTPPFYKALEEYFALYSITLFTPEAIRDAVIQIRKDKLPDPTLQPNTGSFFKNAIIEKWQLEDLKPTYEDIPFYDLGNGTYKIPTGWLIERAGLKGKLLHGMRVHDKNCLVLINEAATGYSDLAAARDEIIATVRDTFRIMIEQEPLEIQ
ncbi:MAG: UDP-N-acetylpyruvoylglucosamine reductase [Candidatus Saccharibacteria bacterium]|nr:UDP-N-acetylpyruvoylglucosamine reductase [Candidatus Saccharibacteria bacterium]